MTKLSIWSVVGLLALGLACSASDHQQAEETADELAREAGEMAKEGAEAVREAAGEVVDTAGELSHDLAKMFEGTKEEVVSRSENALEQLSAGIKKLENEALAAEGAAKEELDKAVAEMKKQHQEASEHLAKMKDSTEENWNEAIHGFRNAFGELQKGLKEATKS